MNENLWLHIVNDIHYKARDLIVKVVPQSANGCNSAKI